MRPGWPQALMVLPTQGLLVLVIGLPALWVFWLSLQETSFGVAPESLSASPTTRSCSATPTSGAPSSTPSSWSTSSSISSSRWRSLMAVMFAAGVPFRRALIAAVLAPYAVSEVIAVIIWKYMLEPEVGIVSQGLAAVGLPELAWTTDRWAALTLVGAALGLAPSAVQLPHPLCGAARRAGGALRECCARRRRHGGSASGAITAAGAGPGDPGGADVPLRLRVPDLRRGLAAHRRRPGAADRGAGDLPLPPRLPLPRVRRRLGDRLADGAGRRC